MIIYDPMPGGSGLLKQMIENWPTLIENARQLVENCPSACETSCPDCLQRFRNAFCHSFLKLTREEYPQKEVSDAVDANQDGSATLEEVRAYYQKRRSTTKQ